MNTAEKARAQLHELQKQPDNRICMDCSARDPRWASVSLGIFICIKCAGAHRNLGAHISSPKSLDQDNWTLEQVEHMRKHGNANAKKYFEATMKQSDTWENSTKKVVSETLSLENYVRKKYEYLDWIPKKPQFSSGVKPRSSTASLPTPTSSGSVLPPHESTKKSSKDDSLIKNSFDKSTDLLGEEFKPRESITKSDIMMMYNNPQLQPTPVSTKTAPAPVVPLQPAKQNYPGPNYNISLNNGYPTQFPGYNPNMMHMNPNMNPNMMNPNMMNPNMNMNMNPNMMPPNPFGHPGYPPISPVHAPPAPLSASFTLAPSLPPPLVPTNSYSNPNVYSNQNNSFRSSNNNSNVPNQPYDPRFAATQFNFR